tara:strand:+ start:78 stop:485 length:408 start_codon:yes stop_codon:yes gene_type:complete
MKFNLRKLEESDYKLLIQWWEQWGWQAPPQEFLPENGAGGFIVSTEETPLCAGFIYFSNSKVAWIDWIISNKEYEDKELKNEAVKYLLHTLTKVAQETGFKFAYTVTSNEGLIKSFKEMGYNIGYEKNTDLLIKL